MECDNEHVIWSEKYRPQRVEDCILPEEIKSTFLEFVENDNFPNLLLTGSSGTGKTTVVRAMCDELNIQYLFINGSEDRNIDTLRNEIRRFASSTSLTGKKKVVVIDEADYLNTVSTMPALRGFMEEFASNCRFIFTCNHEHRIIPAIHSRCSRVSFKFSKRTDESKKLALQFFKRVISILDNEEIEYNKKTVAALITKHYPDFRKVLMELQRCSSSGKIDSGVLNEIDSSGIGKLCGYLKDKDFTSFRKWAAENGASDPSTIFRMIYDGIYDSLDKESIPQAVLIIAEYQYKVAFVNDQEINLVAFFVELAANCKFK